MILPTGVDMKPVTVEAGTTATLSCLISDIKDTVQVVWRDQNSAIIEDGNGYSVVQGLSMLMAFG